ncbi:hypothetical protein Ppa06_54190 [Planomonospora parontospora subsp. parontospora]|uniref:Uncharacterized protein n=2 Tax=Planomonospora parontospora TaxID=58119 RepID=A0AA37BLL0_9ACTN|nr:hypothetical protein GCM10010126_55780 [Planomonospora parontospora]GII11621.1 hypothetical protein Ppa06_54190 [Planomonospora parontospora subsp. parontospora]
MPPRIRRPDARHGDWQDSPSVCPSWESPAGCTVRVVRWRARRRAGPYSGRDRTRRARRRAGAVPGRGRTRDAQDRLRTVLRGCAYRESWDRSREAPVEAEVVSAA